MAAELLLFACPKRSNQEKDTLASAVCRASCPANCASRLRGSLRAHPCALRERARIRARARWAADPAPARRGREGPGKGRARQSCRRSKGVSNPSSVVPAKAGTQRLALALTPLKPRRRADGKAACPARGRREGSRRFGREAMDGLWAKPVHPQRTLAV